MKKFFIFSFLLLIVFSFDTKAQEANHTTEEGQAWFNVGTKTYGISAGTGLGMGALTYNTINWPFLGLHYDKCVINQWGGTIAQGIFAAYNRSTFYFKEHEGKRYGYSSIVLALRLTYHARFWQHNKLDPYIGATLGGRLWMFPKVSMGIASQRLTWVYGGFVGANYKIGKNTAAFAEAGYDVSYFRVGLRIAKIKADKKSH